MFSLANGAASGETVNLTPLKKRRTRLHLATSGAFFFRPKAQCRNAVATKSFAFSKAFYRLMLATMPTKMSAPLFHSCIFLQFAFCRMAVFALCTRTRIISAQAMKFREWLFLPALGAAFSRIGLLQCYFHLKSGGITYGKFYPNPDEKSTRFKSAPGRAAQFAMRYSP